MMNPIRVFVPIVSLVAAFGVAQAEDTIVLSLSLPSETVTSSDRLAIEVTLANVSNVPRYISGDAARRLEFAVRTEDERLVCSWNDPPSPPRPISGPFDLVWIDAEQSLQLVVKVPLASLGIREPGRYRIVGFWSGYALTERDLEEKTRSLAFTYAAPVYVSITDGR